MSSDAHDNIKWIMCNICVGENGPFLIHEMYDRRKNEKKEFST